MSEGWIEVTGRRSFRRGNNLTNRNFNVRETSSEPDETRVQRNFERILKEIQNVYHNATPFLSNLLKDIKSRITHQKLHIYALGCGTVENTSMVLAKSCLYQWAVCILLVHLLKPASVHIFDPVMSKTDYLVWDKLLKFNYKFKKKDQSDDEQDEGEGEECKSLSDPHSHSSLSKNSGLDSHFDSNSHSEPQFHSNSGVNISKSFNSNSNSNSSEDATVILWMPHCEKFLYKAVLDGILDNLSPLKVSRSLSQNDSPPHLQSTQSSPTNLVPDEPTESDKDNLDNEDDEDEQEEDESLTLSLENTILVGNSLSDFSLTDLTFKDSFSLSETALLPFHLHTQSFNDTFITTFTKL